MPKLMIQTSKLAGRDFDEDGHDSVVSSHQRKKSQRRQKKEKTNKNRKAVCALVSKRHKCQRGKCHHRKSDSDSDTDSIGSDSNDSDSFSDSETTSTGSSEEGGNYKDYYKKGKSNRHSPRIKGRENMKKHNASEIMKHRGDRLKPEPFNGHTPLEAFIRQLEDCSEYNDWNEKEKALHLRMNLRGVAAQILDQEDSRKMSYDELIGRLRRRYGTDGQMALFRAQLRGRRRGKDEPLLSVYTDISRLTALAYPGRQTEHSQSIAVDAFIDSLGDEDLEKRIREMFIRDHSPPDLDAVYRAAVMLEANNRSRSTRENEGARRFGGWDRRARAVNEIREGEGDNKFVTAKEVQQLKVDLEQMLDRKFSVLKPPPCNATNNEARGATRAPPPSSEQQQQNRRRPLECYNCAGNHLAKDCPNPRQPQRRQWQERGGGGNNQQQRCGVCGEFGHIAPNCPRRTDNSMREGRQAVLNARGGMSGGDCYPAYIKLRHNNQIWTALLDTGCEVSMVPARLVRNEIVLPTLRTVLAANGTNIAIAGELQIDLELGGLIIPTNVLVSEYISEPMLGIDWITNHRCKLDFDRSTIIIHDYEFPLHRNTHERACMRIVAARSVRIPALSQMTVGGKMEVGRIWEGEPTDWMTEAVQLQDGVCVARAVLPNRCNDVPVLMMNCTEKPVKIRAGTQLAELTAADVINESNTTPVVTLYPEQCVAHVSELLEGVDESVNEEEKQQLKSLLNNYADVFSASKFDLGETNLVVHTIDTQDARPFRQQLRNHPRTTLEEIDTEVKGMLDAGIIEPSQSPWLSNLVVVRKKDNTARICVDYRQLNLLTRKDAYPLPRIDACLDALSGAKFFSSFDLTSGFYQVLMADVDADKTSFATRNGTYRFRRMPMGLCNSASTFMRVMDLALKGINITTLVVYLDDVIVHAGSVSAMFERLEMFFQRLRSANLKLKPSKCKLLRKELPFLGYIVSDKGVKTDPEKIKMVVEWPVPTNVSEVRSFLGLCSYYRKFVHNFASTAAALHALTGKNVLFRWTTECQAAFDGLKEKLTTSPILSMPRDDCEYVLDTDASDKSIGAVLSQHQDGQERVIAYSSRLLHGPELNYCVTRKELLAVVFYLKHFRQYLLGTFFYVRSDHAALQWLQRTPQPIGQQARWLEQMQEYDFKIVHRAGRSHQNADALSRRPCKQCGLQDEEAEREPAVARAIQLANPGAGDGPFKPSIMASALREDDELKDIVNLLEQHKEQPPFEAVEGLGAVTKALYTQWDRLRLIDGVLYRRWYGVDGVRDKWQLIPPRKFYREQIIATSHAGFTGGHYGLKRTLDRVQSKSYWVGWRNDVARAYRACQECARYFRGALPRKGEMQSMNLKVGEPWQILSMDIVGPVTQSSGQHRFILTILDLFTKFAFAIPLRNHEATTVARVLVDDVISMFGMPLAILTDRGGEFEGHLMKELCSLLQIEKLRTTAFKPSTNGQIERFHRGLNGLLAKVIGPAQRDWHLWLPFVMSAYRATRHNATNYSPNFLMFGREFRAPLDLAFGPPDEDEGLGPQLYDGFVCKTGELMRKSYALVREHLKTAALRSKNAYDAKVREAKYPVGSFVWYYYPRRITGRNIKWEKLYQGPYLVTRHLGLLNYEIQKSPKSNKIVTHVDKLKACYSNTPPSWIKETDEQGPLPVGPGPVGLEQLFQLEGELIQEKETEEEVWEGLEQQADDARGLVHVDDSQMFNEAYNDTDNADIERIVGQNETQDTGDHRPAEEKNDDVIDIDGKCKPTANDYIGGSTENEHPHTEIDNSMELHMEVVDEGRVDWGDGDETNPGRPKRQIRRPQRFIRAGYEVCKND